MIIIYMATAVLHVWFLAPLESIRKHLTEHKSKNTNASIDSTTKTNNNNTKNSETKID